MRKFATIGNYMLEEYFLTGEIPYGDEYPDEIRVKELDLFAACLNASAVALCVNVPDQVHDTLAKAASILGMDKYEPILPPTGEGFMEYGRRSGLITQRGIGQ